MNPADRMGLGTDMPPTDGRKPQYGAHDCPNKRSIDILVAMILLLFLAPALLLIAAAIRCESRGPAFFRQRRTGLNGRIFRIYKFRTMRVTEDGDTIVHAGRHDARVTRVGALLRRTSLDEVPQLLNIWLGDMSLVGPRPHAIAHDFHYTRMIPHYPLRFAARPGLTGLAQIRGLRGEIHHLGCMQDRVAADAEYIERWTLWLDALIIIKTVPRVLYDKQAY